MRTTVIIDDDLAELLKRRACEGGVPFERVLNDGLRVRLRGGAPAAKPYRMKPRKLGVRSGINLTKALRVAGELEDVENVQELEQGR